MAEVKWIKIVTDIFDDEKILLIESMPDRDAVIVIWFKLLCLAGKQNNGGVFMLNDKIPYTDEMLSTIFRRPINTVRLAIDTFQHFGMIEIVNDCITIPNWNRHQSLDALEKKREYQRQLMKKRREEQRKIACNTNCDTNCDANGDTNRDANVSRLEREEEREGEGDKKEREERETRTRAPLSPAPAVDNVESSNGDFVSLKDFPLVKITKEELRKLRKLDLTATRKSLDAYFASMTVQLNKGREYGSHFEMIRKWMMQDGAKISNSSIDDDMLDKIMNPYSS
jgi:predicted phage replisome organizer